MATSVGGHSKGIEPLLSINGLPGRSKISRKGLEFLDLAQDPSGLEREPSNPPRRCGFLKRRQSTRTTRRRTRWLQRSRCFNAECDDSRNRHAHYGLP